MDHSLKILLIFLIQFAAVYIKYNKDFNYIIIYLACHRFCAECFGPTYLECQMNECTTLIPHIAMIANNQCYCDTPYFLNETEACEGNNSYLYMTIYL